MEEAVIIKEEPGQNRELPFEEAVQRLESIVARLERGELSLDEALRLFEEGIGLTRMCQQQLNRTQHKIEILTEGPDGKVKLRPTMMGEEGV